jgi:hypothetical protein
MTLLDKDTIGLYYISRQNLYKLFPYTLRHQIIKDEVSPNTINISKKFRLDKDGIIYNKMRIRIKRN